MRALQRNRYPVKKCSGTAFSKADLHLIVRAWPGLSQPMRSAMLEEPNGKNRVQPTKSPALPPSLHTTH